jgi:ribosomal subunit interface protein
MSTKRVILPAPRLVVRGEFGVGVEDVVVRKLAHLERHAREPVLDVHVLLTRSEQATDGRGVCVAVALDLNGRAVRAEAEAPGLLDALDQTVARLARQLDDRPHRHRKARTKARR